MDTLKPKYFLYARKSTEDDDHQIMSIEAQLFELREFARRENLDVLQEYTESKSAKTPGREVFNEMMTRIEQGEVNGILAWHPDRLARNSVDGGRVIYLVDTGKIVSLRFPTFWFEPTPQGKFMLQVAFGQSKYYSDNLIENINRGIRQKLRRGEWLTKAPFGYVNNPKTRTIEPHPTHSRVIKLAFQEYAKGTYTYEKLAEFLADHGVTQKIGTPLGKASVVRILTNRAYLGFVKHKNEYHDGSFEPILSPTLFEAVQKELLNHRKPRKSKIAHDFPFIRMMQCGECEAPVTAQYSLNRFGTKYIYYHCTKKHGVCTQKYIQESALAALLTALLGSVSLPLEEIEGMEKQMQTWETESISSRGSIAHSLKAKLAETKERLEKLVSIYLDGDIERDIYLEQKDKLMRERAALEEEIKLSGQSGQHWLSPLRSFVLSLREATKLAEEKNIHGYSTFFKSIGSNPILKDKTIHISFNPLWDFTAQSIADCRYRSAAFAERAPRGAGVFSEVSVGGG